MTDFASAPLVVKFRVCAPFLYVCLTVYLLLLVLLWGVVLLDTNWDINTAPKETEALILFSRFDGYNCSKQLSLMYKSLSPFSNFTEPTQPLWMKSNRLKKTYFLVEALQVRIYKDDKAKWTIREMKQWMHYMFWSGVEHIYMCDHYKFVTERLDKPLRKYIEHGLLTYIQWNATHAPMDAQVRCYREVIKRYGDKTDWMISVDMDEYPHVFGDYREGFLNRYLKKQANSTAVVQLHNFLMLGVGDRTRDITIERINRVTPKRANLLDKAIFRPRYASPDIHTARIRGQYIQATSKIDAPEGEAILAHYWGARLQDWGPDKPSLLNETVVFNDLRNHVAPSIRLSLLLFGECDAFSTSSGP